METTLITTFPGSGAVVEVQEPSYPGSSLDLVFLWCTKTHGDMRTLPLNRIPLPQLYAVEQGSSKKDERIMG